MRSRREHRYYLRGDSWSTDRAIEGSATTVADQSRHCLVHEHLGQIHFDDVSTTCDNARNRVYEILRQRMLLCPDDNAQQRKMVDNLSVPCSRRI